MFPSLVVLLFWCAVAVATIGLILNSYGRVNNPEIRMTTIEIVRHRGYPAEAHSVTTEDGYIIEMHRIPYGKKSPPSANKPAVFLHHGLMSSSADWIMSNNGLGYYLADAGFDVWLGNVRGNTYGRQHVSLDPDLDSEFWEFSFDEYGRFDVAAQLKSILQLTQQDKLSFVGHSQGSVNFWVAMESNPDLNEKIDVMFALGPVARMGNMTNSIIYAAPYSDHIKMIMEFQGMNELMSSTYFFKFFAEEICSDDVPSHRMCTEFLMRMFDLDVSAYDTSLLPLFFSHTPAGTSIRNLDHYHQIYTTGTFSRYDYGVAGNLEHYQQETAPSYDLKAVKAPVILVWGKEDTFSDPLDVQWLASQLPNLLEDVLISRSNFSHMEFAWGNDVASVCYSILVEKINEILKKKS